MSGKVNAMQIFSTPVFTADLEAFTEHRDGLIEHINYMKENADDRNVSNIGGWQSNDRFHQENNPHVQWLINQFTEFTNACVTSIHGDELTDGLKLCNSWANVNPRHCWNAPHTHLPADWSGVVYIDIKDEHVQNKFDGNIVFIDPTPFISWPGRTSTQFLKPCAGMLVLFPGYLMHMVVPHTADSDRISVAINYKLGNA